MNIFNQTVFGSGFFFTPSQKHNGTFSEIYKPFIKNGTFHTHILLEATVKLWLMSRTSVPTQNDIKT